LLGALAIVLATDSPGQAAWNNVFQVSCFHHRRTTAAYLAPSCCQQTAVVAAAPVDPCPQPCQPQCTTRYVQRCYYQPVTTYKQQCYYEPVTSYQTSYYYEPVCSYRYSCYYDPCTCSYQQVATPVTSYQLRSRCNAVTSYLQRTQLVPVCSYQLRTYYEPQTTCCSTTVGAPVLAVPNGAPVVGGAPAVGAAPAVGGAPVVGEQQQIPRLQPRVGEDPSQRIQPRIGEDPGASRFQETNPPPMSPAHDSSFRQLDPRPLPANQPANPPRVRLDRIVMLDSPNVEGQVVGSDTRIPRAGARLLFVSAEQDGAHKTVTADEQGRFQTTLVKGSWLVYVRNREGTPVFQKRIEVQASQTSQVLLTSR
jgi:hypothetical protein